MEQATVVSNTCVCFRLMALTFGVRRTLHSNYTAIKLNMQAGIPQGLRICPLEEQYGGDKKGFLWRRCAPPQKPFHKQPF